VKITLYKIKIWPGASKKSVCLYAEIRLNGHHVADVINDGEGGQHRIKVANELCEARLAQVKAEVNLDTWIDEQVALQSNLVELDEVTGDLKIKK
jgi:hypothetical protein